MMLKTNMVMMKTKVIEPLAPNKKLYLKFLHTITLVEHTTVGKQNMVNRLIAYIEPKCEEVPRKDDKKNNTDETEEC